MIAVFTIENFMVFTRCYINHLFFISYLNKAYDLKIRAGEWDTQTTKERLPFQERIVSRIFGHPNYNERGLANDIVSRMHNHNFKRSYRNDWIIYLNLLMWFMQILIQKCCCNYFFSFFDIFQCRQSLNWKIHLKWIDTSAPCVCRRLVLFRINRIALLGICSRLFFWCFLILDRF